MWISQCIYLQGVPASKYQRLWISNPSKGAEEHDGLPGICRLPRPTRRQIRGAVASFDPVTRVMRGRRGSAMDTSDWTEVETDPAMVLKVNLRQLLHTGTIQHLESMLDHPSLEICQHGTVPPRLRVIQEDETCQSIAIKLDLGEKLGLLPTGLIKKAQLISIVTCLHFLQETSVYTGITSPIYRLVCWEVIFIFKDPNADGSPEYFPIRDRLVPALVSNP
ncbi:hypothetical protein C8J56DRAFT_896105 [Mycena floridula]|nr:hypothetical protein C8J56DRAFT_896105 [Mycena floridula]